MSYTISSIAVPSLVPFVVDKTVTAEGKSPDAWSLARSSTLSEMTPTFTPVPSTP